MYIPGKFSIVIGLVALALIPLIALRQGGTSSGSVVESERQVESFTRIASGGTAEVRIHRSDRIRVVVTTNANLQDLFEARASNGVLSLGFKPGTVTRRATRLTVDVYLPELDGVTVSGSGTATLVDRFDGDELNTIVSGSGSIEGSLHYESLAAVITGSGSVKLAGACPRLGITVSGSGAFEGLQLSAVSASVTLSGSGSVTLDVGSSLDAIISGSGKIRYNGEPAVSSRITGSGTIRRTGS